jgi:hypothetical protein
MKFVLLALAVVSLAHLLRTSNHAGASPVALITAANLVANLAFFTHPLVTPYYTVPIAMLSL